MKLGFIIELKKKLKTLTDNNKVFIINKKNIEKSIKKTDIVINSTPVDIDWPYLEQER